MLRQLRMKAAPSVPVSNSSVCCFAPLFVLSRNP